MNLGNRWMVGAAIVAVLAAPVPAALGRQSPGSSAISGPLPGVPAGAPPPAHRPSPVVPGAAGWPFGEAFPHTSGAGRVAGGALFWSDFLYDDNGAIGRGPATNESSGAPSQGTYRYPEVEQAGNGADILRAAVGADADATWWRVDWNTLVAAHVPVAAFAIDGDADPGTGATEWGFGAGLRSPGIDHVLLLSAAGAWRRDARTGAVVRVAEPGAGLTVDERSRSFVLRLPHDELGGAPSGVSDVRLAAGLADGEGDGFLPLGLEHGALPGQPAVYNVTFRDYADEAPSAWFDDAQVRALTSGGDVSAFSVRVDWSRLAAGEHEPEPVVTGYTNRWYVSSVEPGQGVVPGDITRRDPAYLGRVQPYMAFVPGTYRPGAAAPLTWHLHGGFSNHNSQPATNPGFLEGLCEARGSICASPLGRGPSGFYRGTAELDFWEVWRSLAEDFTLDATRTLVGGYSMGGFGTYHLATQYPDVFAGAFIQASNASGAAVLPSEGGCRPGAEPGSGTPFDSLENLRWTPVYHAQGAQDQLAFATEAEKTVRCLDELGYRHRYDLYTVADHVAYSVSDTFDDLVAWAAEEDRTVRSGPGRITYRWHPAEARPDLGVAPTGAWWVGGLQARDEARPAARVDAVSAAAPEPAVTAVRTAELRPAARPSPAVRRELRWALGTSAEPRPALEVDLANVGAVALALDEAGIAGGEDATVAVRTDGPVTLSLTGLRPGAELRVAGGTLAHAGPDGSATVHLPAGDHALAVVYPG